MLPTHLAFIDLETTGANPAIDRITEIGLIEVVEGRVARWSTLVNPERPIPEFIQRLTGIRNDMVADAPTFAEVAEELRTRLHGKLFIAHNARFDYSFVKQEFRRLGQRFQADVLCTVRLSRKLFPEHHKHNLDSLIVRHGLYAEGRHRALADAELIWQFWQKARLSHTEEVLLAALQPQLKQPTLPPHLDPAVLDDLPETPGVYLIYGEGDICLYVGKSINLRQRVFSHFAAAVGNSGGEYKEMDTTSRSPGRPKNDLPPPGGGSGALTEPGAQFSQQVRRLDWRETVGEVGALLLESSLLKQLKPLYNRRLHEHPEICAWRLEEVEPGDFRPSLVYAVDVDFGAADHRIRRIAFADRQIGAIGDGGDLLGGVVGRIGIAREKRIAIGQRQRRGRRYAGADRAAQGDHAGQRGDELQLECHRRTASRRQRPLQVAVCALDSATRHRAECRQIDRRGATRHIVDAAHIVRGVGIAVEQLDFVDDRAAGRHRVGKIVAQKAVLQIERQRRRGQQRSADKCGANGASAPSDGGQHVVPCSVFYGKRMTHSPHLICHLDATAGSLSGLTLIYSATAPALLYLLHPCSRAEKPR